MPHLPLLAFLFIAAQTPAPGTCLQSLRKPSYPAVRFAPAGMVTAHFTINGVGKVQGATYQSSERITPDGNNLLAREVEDALDRTTLDPQCKGEYTVIYRFTLNQQRSADRHVTVEFNPPNEFVVKDDHDVVTCSVYSVIKPSLRKRLSAKLRKRPRPQTITTVECY